MTTNSAAGTRSTVGPDTIKNAFREMMDDEAKHVSFFEAALKKAGRPSRRADLQGARTIQSERFHQDVRHPREYRVAAFLMAIPAISDKNYAAAAESIVTIEPGTRLCECLARQASQRKRRIRQTHLSRRGCQSVSPFIASLNGGPDPADALANDTVILNFALLLEHLERSSIALTFQTSSSNSNW
jgi:hypothetical protein